MCFHFSLTIDIASIESALDVVVDDSVWQPVYHADGFTFLKMPVITQEDPSRLQLFKWGLIPSWVKTNDDAEKLRAQTLNARSETVFEKPSFRTAIRRQRCLVPADGFFEWMDVGGKKYPHYIYMKGHSLFTFGGLYEQWADKATGELIQTFSIITTEANPLMARIHNLKKRMPVIVSEENRSQWLDKNAPNESIQDLCSPYPDADMEYHTISKRITSRSEDSNVPETLLPFTYEGLPSH